MGCDPSRVILRKNFILARIGTTMDIFIYRGYQRMTFTHFQQDWLGLINLDLITVAFYMEFFCEFTIHENFIVFVSFNFYTTNFDGWVIYLGFRVLSHLLGICLVNHYSWHIIDFFLKSLAKVKSWKPLFKRKWFFWEKHFCWVIWDHLQNT